MKLETQERILINQVLIMQTMLKLLPVNFANHEIIDLRNDLVEAVDKSYQEVGKIVHIRGLKETM